MARKRKLQISASPVAEGVRFRVGSAAAFAVRRESKDIALRIRRERRPFRDMLERLPFVRGMHRLVGSVAGLLDGISESSELEPQRIARGTRFEQAFARMFRIHPESLVAFTSAVLIPIILIGLIYALPRAAQVWLLPNFDLTRAGFNAIVCLIRVLGALLGIFLCTRLRVVRRLCMYQGAINKVLNAWEADRKAEPTHAAAMEASRHYHKSDAMFVTLVALLSIVAFALIRTFTLPVQVLVRALAVLVIAGIVNEPIQALERMKPGRPLAKLLIPYLWLGRMFVMEPHSQMVEVAVYAFNAARENDE